MAVEKAIYYILENSNSLSSAKISFGVNQEISQQTTPYQQSQIIFYKNSTEPYATKGTNGPLSGRSTIDRATIKIEILAESALTLSTLTSSVRGALDRQSGTFSGCVVQSIDYLNEDNEFEFDDGLSNRGWYQCNQYYAVRFEPSYI
tara:strand:- start:1630 stop:2070 length:441 start_codon:yes stop_codon:yes gene_type:complete